MTKRRDSAAKSSGRFSPPGQDASFESLPPSRAWIVVLRGKRDGFFPTLRTSEQERICWLPDEPLALDRSVLFVRTADIGKLNFSSFDDLIGHDIAVLPGWAEHPGLSPELWSSLREHYNLSESNSFETEEAIYVCFSKARVSPSLVEAFSRALKQFKRTEAFKVVYRKYFP